MSQFPEPAEQLKDTPLRFLESEQCQEMLDTYNKLKPLEKEHPRKFKNQMNVFDFGDIYPLMDSYLQTHDLSSPEAVAEAVTIGASETVTFAATLLDILSCSILVNFADDNLSFCISYNIFDRIVHIFSCNRTSLCVVCTNFTYYRAFRSVSDTCIKCYYRDSFVNAFLKCIKNGRSIACSKT